MPIRRKRQSRGLRITCGLFLGMGKRRSRSILLFILLAHASSFDCQHCRFAVAVIEPYIWPKVLIVVSKIGDYILDKP